MNTIKKSRKALALNRETLRTLQSNEIAGVIGGVDSTPQGESRGFRPPTIDSGRPVCCTM
jgi:hypothetical protein